jgi:hypothetical protein
VERNKYDIKKKEIKITSMIRIIEKFLLALTIIFVACFVSTKPVYALSISVSNLPTSIDRDQETEVDLFFSCAGCGDYSYIRSVFYSSGTNYFGLTQNNSGSWVGTAGDRSQYFAIAKTDLIDASWSGKLKIKPDSGDSAYTGPGEYMFKVGRYTSASDSSADWSNELAVKITGPTPAPISEPRQTPAPSPTPAKTPAVIPTSTKAPTPTPTRLPLPPSTTEVLGVETFDSIPTSTPAPDGKIIDKTQGKFPGVAFGLIFLGLALIGGSSYAYFKTNNKVTHEETLI